MKKIYRRLICLFCSLILTAINITVFAVKSVEEAPLDKPNESRSAVFGCVLNDYINRIGVISDEHPSGFKTENTRFPNGLVYADIVNFDNNENPYLVLFMADSKEKGAACHIWKYDSETEKAQKIAQIPKPYSNLNGLRGAFSIGWNNDKRYIVYKELDGEKTVNSEYFTVIDGTAFRYVEEPDAVNQAAVINFTGRDFRSDVNISYYNAALTQFFDTLKNAAADSVTYAEVSDILSDDEEKALEEVTADAADTGNFDILAYETMDDYETSLMNQHNGSRLSSVTSVYALGDEMYYVRFSTEDSFYNYALLRHTDRAEQYQILKVRMDCIPLSDRELNTLHKDYSKSILLYKKAKSSASGGYTAPTRAPEKDELIPLPKLFSLPRIIDRSVRMPAVYLSAALTVLLMTGLWVYMYGGDEEDV